MSLLKDCDFVNDCGCLFFVINLCDTCNEPPGCPVDPVNFVATDTEPSEEIPVGIEVEVNIAGDYDILNPSALGMDVGDRFFTTIPLIQFAPGTQLQFDITSLPRVLRGQRPFDLCCPNGQVCTTNSRTVGDCPEDLFLTKVCPPEPPCNIKRCKVPLSCLNDACDEGSVSAILTKDLPTGTIIFVWLELEEVFVKLVLLDGFPPVSTPICGTIKSNAADIGIVETRASVGELSYQWYQGRLGDVRNPVGIDQSTLINPDLQEFYWVRVRDDCGFCNSEEFFFADLLGTDDLTDTSVLPPLIEDLCSACTPFPHVLPCDLSTENLRHWSVEAAWRNSLPLVWNWSTRTFHALQVVNDPNPQLAILPDGIAIDGCGCPAVIRRISPVGAVICTPVDFNFIIPSPLNCQTQDSDDFILSTFVVLPDPLECGICDKPPILK